MRKTAVTHSPDLVRQFIERQVNEHPEPEHKGTPRGEPVGFSKKKLRAAALMALSGRTERELAKQLRVSESLLRKWYCEERYKETMRKQVFDFAQFFTVHIEAAAAFGELGGHHGMDAPVDPAGSEVPSPALECVIYDEVKKVLEQQPVTWSQVALHYVTAFLRAKDRAGDPKKWIYNRDPHNDYWKAWERHGVRGGPLEESARLLRNHLYLYLEELFQRPSLGQTDRAEGRALISTLRKTESGNYG